MTIKKVAAALAVMLLTAIAAPTNASASTITLAAIAGNLYQQSLQNPCIFDNPSCKQPAGFASTAVPNQGNVASWDLMSPVYSGSTLLNLLSGAPLRLGLDINQASGQGAQTLDYFAMLKNGVVVDSYTGSSENVPDVNNGNGFADYLLSGFSTFSAGDTIQFEFKFSGANDGAENVFLISGAPTTSPVPEPASMLLVGTGLLAAARARRRNSR